ncbi:MAG TPA: TetR/AcrR family transcriptional regulator [Bryobacteraceae bacterium]|nr:TetR/AcrR family transcriptional regulator [Bryobacteraceae bacterium]
MVSYAPSRRERKKQETRDRIISAGLALFTRQGIDGSTIDEVASAADVGKGTIYNYFRTKEDIIVAFLMDIEQQVQREIAQAGSGSGSLQSVLTRIIRLQFRRKEAHYGFVRVFLARLCASATPQSEWLQEIQRITDPPLIRLFTALRTRGVVRTDVDLPTLVGAFKIMHLGLTIVWAIEGPPWPNIANTVREQVRLFCSGIEVKR